MRNKLKVGIVGCGNIAVNTHLPILYKIKDIEITAICTRNKNITQKIMDRFDIKNHYTDYKHLSNMIQEEDLDVVDICTPPWLHAPLSIQAMEAGSNVIVEKPMAMNIKEADKMIKTAKDNNVGLFPIHDNLFHPLIIKAKSLIKSRLIGDLVGLEAEYLRRRDDPFFKNKNHWSHKLPGGIFFDTLPHPIYLMQSFLGDLNSVAVQGHKFSDYSWIKADELRVILKSKKGMGTVHLSYNSPIKGVIINILGTKMNLHLDLWNMIIIKYKHVEKDIFARGKENLNQSFQILTNTASAMVNYVFGRIKSGHQILIPNFIEAVKGNVKPLVTKEDGRENVRVLEKIINEMKI